MASGSVLVSAVHVSVSEVPGLSTGSREPRPASRPNLDVLGLGFGLDHPGLGLSLGGPGLDYNPDFFHVVSNFSGGMRPESGRVVLVLGRVRGGSATTARHLLPNHSSLELLKWQHLESI